MGKTKGKNPFFLSRRTTQMGKVIEFKKKEKEKVPDKKDQELAERIKNLKNHIERINQLQENLKKGKF